jgi:hypothetical protein
MAAMVVLVVAAFESVVMGAGGASPVECRWWREWPEEWWGRHDGGGW